MFYKIDNYLNQLEPGVWVAHFGEDGSYQIVKKSDFVKEIRHLAEVDEWSEVEGLISPNWRGFKSRRDARLYCLRFLRSWRDEIDGAVKDLMAEKALD